VNIELNIASIKEKALILIPTELEKKFSEKFDSEVCYDLMENIEDYIAEGVASYFLNE
jgi:hypothetical protein